jgi:hypothetical protein
LGLLQGFRKVKGEGMKAKGSYKHIYADKRDRVVIAPINAVSSVKKLSAMTMDDLKIVSVGVYSGK